jgi:toxin ParE1/3/4
MSDRTFELEVAENAQRDIIEIRLYSTEVWGDQQADEIVVRLSAGFESLQSNPQLGKSEDDMRPGLRQLVVGEHRILYRIVGDVVWILRVVHTRMDLSRMQL